MTRNDLERYDVKVTCKLYALLVPPPASKMSLHFVVRLAISKTLAIFYISIWHCDSGKVKYYVIFVLHFKAPKFQEVTFVWTVIWMGQLQNVLR